MAVQMKKKDELGDRMKEYERHETGRKFLPMLPVYARIDGRGFSKFTAGMSRPFDPRMTDAMIETTKYLVSKSGAVMGYVQSDEISLAWHAPEHTASIFFDGKTAKMTSVLASMAAAKFNHVIRGWKPYDDKLPAFDARVLQMPLPYEVANMFLWRALDATKNSVSMATRSVYSAKEMHGKGQAEMKAMLAERGIDFDDYPVAFREGTFVRRVVVSRELTEVEKAAAFYSKVKQDPSGLLIRSSIEAIPMPKFNTVANRTEVIFEGAEPILKDFSVA